MADLEKQRKNHRVGFGRDKEVEPVNIVFNTSFRYTNPWYNLWLVNFDSLRQVYVKTYINHLTSSAQGQIDTTSMWYPPTSHILIFLQKTFRH